MRLNIKLTEGTRGSHSAKRLASSLSKKLGYKVLRTLKPSLRRKQLLYGQGVDKLTQFKYFEQQGLSAIEYTPSALIALEWLNDGDTVIGRKLLSSSCGKGIVIYKPEDDIPTGSCPVYTKYKKKKREFRVHVFKDKVVAVVEKKLRSNWDGPRDTHIRNLANGYVFCAVAPENIPTGLVELAVAGGRVVQSDFKGVDIGYNEKHNELFLIEVNSAPGMEGSNVEAYAKAVVESI